MREDDIEIAIKVVIVGNGGVGKSSMIQRYCKGIFTKDYKKTIGVDFLERQIEIDGEDVRIMLWDTAGQEEFDAITKAYYRGAQACVLTFSTTDRASFEAIRDWKRKVENECNEIPTVIVQNKIDLIEQSVVSADEVETLARQLNCRLIRTSVKEDVNVASVFRYLATKCHQLMLNESSEQANAHAGGNGGGGGGGGGGLNGGSSGHQPTISAFSPTFTKNNSGTIVLRAAKKSSAAARKRKIVLKKCGIL
ncbi:PREDICTED: ras-related protein Rab-23 [Rhagoletis zephyria]|uniref:ras-related protein Rab-23 n=1 Tax=Rhagoletis zephyria TaxID=28612 RepID=UPI000811374A|nr:PREDICTED: ras-related protein Rab-23 [Rhagoletis zephyria]XP_017490600.1 PREDICTED: ras-related protein Rab-23 [Rhagoletis zephyria]XP_017490601.1 PREDICTED: ras-related protein Rab-23 [Rhagoletis zephyria]